MKKLLIFVFILCGCIGRLFAQSEIELEQNPPDVKWEQINTPHFRIIYPEGFEAEAQRTANTLEHIYEPASRTLGKRPRRLSVILQNRSSISNGFVTITPRRSEFFTMPPQDYSFIGSNDWIELLAVHELRHVVQYDKSITGINRLFYYLFGNNVLAGLGAISAPDWFWEGDAVGTETALTPAGRGRMPVFDLTYRTNLLERGAFTYNKSHLGSFRHYVPNHYVLGYHLTTYLKRKYGANVWDTISKRAFGRSLIPFTFSNAIRHQTGKYLVKTYREMNRELDSLWRKQLEGLPVTEAQTISKSYRRRFTNYEYPNYLSDGRRVALRSGIGDIQQFVAIDDNGNEEVLFTPGIMNENGMLSVENDKIVWNEYHFDPRWAVQTYLVVKSYDVKTRQYKVLTEKTRLSAPALSPDASKVVVVDVSQESKYALVLLDAGTGKELKRFDNPENNFYTMPRFSDDGSRIVALRIIPRKGKTIALIDVNTGAVTDLLPYSHENFGHPVLKGNYVYYSSPYSGIDNIYAVDIKTGQRWQVTSRKSGAYTPHVSADGKKLLFNDYQVDGMAVAEMSLDPALWTPLEKVEKRSIEYFQPMVESEGNTDLLKGIPATKYETKKYSKFRHLFNVYSWLPTVSPIDRTLSFSINSQDLLSTNVFSAGYLFNANERSGYGFAGISYQGWYPIIDLVGRAGRRSVTEKKDTSSVKYDWTEQGLDLGLRVPLTLTRSRFLERLELGAKYSINHISGNVRPVGFDKQGQGTLHTMNYHVGYRRTLKRSFRDLLPRLGVTAQFNLYHTPLGGDYQGNLLALETNGYLPGLFRHHAIRLRAGYQHENAVNYRFLSPLFFPRGFGYVAHRDFYNGSVEYRFPIVYPDIAIGPLLNIQRIKGGFFADFGYGQDRFTSTTYQSIGIDLSTDLNILRASFGGLDLGVRFIYLPQTGKTMIQPTIGLFGF